MTTIPVLQMPSSEGQSWDGLTYIWEQDFYIPSFWVLGPDMTVLAEDTQYPDDPGRYID